MPFWQWRVGAPSLCYWVTGDYISSSFSWTTYGGLALNGAGDTLAVLDGGSGGGFSGSVLTLFDVTDPTAPSQLSQTDLGYSSGLCTPKWMGDYVYITKNQNGIGGRQLKHYDVSVTTSPSLAATTTLHFNGTNDLLWADFGIFDATITGNPKRVVACMETENPSIEHVTLYIYDLNSPGAAPTYLGELNDANMNFGGDFSFGGADKFFYWQTNNGTYKMQSADLTDPTAPVFIGTFGDNLTGEMKVDNNRLYVANGNSGTNNKKIHIYDVSDPYSVPAANTFYLNDVSGNFPVGMAIDGNTLFANTCTTTDRVIAEDVTTPSAHSFLGQCAIPNSYCPNYGIVVVGGYQISKVPSAGGGLTLVTTQLPSLTG